LLKLMGRPRAKHSRADNRNVIPAVVHCSLSPLLTLDAISVGRFTVHNRELWLPYDTPFAIKIREGQ